MSGPTNASREKFRRIIDFSRAHPWNDTQNHMYRCTNPDTGAIERCVIGLCADALGLTTHEFEATPEYGLMFDHVVDVYGHVGGPINWNDQPDRTREDVLRLLEELHERAPLP